MNAIESIYASLEFNRCALPVVDAHGRAIGRGDRLAYRVETTTAGAQEGTGSALAILPNGAIVIHLDEAMPFKGLDGGLAMEMRTFAFLSSFKALGEEGGQFICLGKGRSGKEIFVKVVSE